MINRTISLLTLLLTSCSVIFPTFVFPDKCDDLNAVRCDGSVLVTCEANFEVRLDCGDLDCNAEEKSCGNCGDSTVSGAEQCDDGPNNSDTIANACRTDCTNAGCGDNVIDSGEECDDNNTIATDSCTDLCLNAVCGDGRIRTGFEECDDDNTTSGDGCDANCVTEFCGDGIINEDATTGVFDQCDDANNNDNDGCDANCVTEFCGDGTINEDSISGILDQCDDDNNANNDGCDANCIIEFCGDGTINKDATTGNLDTCDDGNNINNDGCDADCDTEFCGDGTINRDAVSGIIDQCDDGNNTNNDGCNATCKNEVCGDGVINNVNETCDDTNTAPNDGCSPTCLTERCGDGLLNLDATTRVFDQCDDGNNNNGDGCNAICKKEFCGDNTVNKDFNTGILDQCDDGNTTAGDGCNAICRDEFCGDNIINDTTEECDFGDTAPNDGCGPTCRIERCGDGFVNLDSLTGLLDECDDNNRINGDGCDSNCNKELCGDNILNRDFTTNLFDECDDGNNTNGDGCNANCRDEFCGDGVINNINEECDFGDTTPNDGCGPTCLIERCGDGFVNRDVVTNVLDQCDDGNTISGDGCSANCIDEFCGDGITNDTNEDCDDANAIAGDGCENNCTFTSIIQLSTGGEHACALTSGHEVICWGLAGSGRLGYENLNNIGDNEPVFVAGKVDVGGSVRQISAGGFHTCAVLDNGKVRCWGEDNNGRLGNGVAGNIGDNAGEMPPANVNIGNGTVTQVAAGNAHTCVLLDTGKVRCWGQATAGQLGYENTTEIGLIQTPAVAYASLPNNGDVNVGGTVTQIVAGADHNCALLDTGNVRCWGQNVDSQLGDGTTTIRGIAAGQMPPPNVNLGSGAVATQITSTNDHTCALLNTGKVRCWGHGGDGRLGYESGTFFSVPPGDVNVGGAVTQIAAGFAHTCAVLTSGAVRCWGLGNLGQLGYGNVNTLGDAVGEMPTPNVNVGAAVSAVSAGSLYTCALLTNGGVRCWGSSLNGQLGYGLGDTLIGNDEVPASVAPVTLNGTVSQVYGGAAHSCALSSDGFVSCWGNGTFGRLGYANTNNIGIFNTPASAGNVDVGGPVAQLSLGDQHTCALLTTGNVRCWGQDARDRIGYGIAADIGDNETPASAGDVNIGGQATQISARLEHTCVLLTTGEVRCWGGVNSFGELGVPGTQAIPANNNVVPVGGTVVQIEAGRNHTCAILTAGNVRCWGLASSGQLGYGNTTNIGVTITPATAGDVSVGGAVSQLALGSNHTCALLTTGAVRCWGVGFALGSGNRNNIGDNELPSSIAPLDLGPGTVVEIQAGDNFTCARFDTGDFRCWGGGGNAQLGYGTTAFGTDLGDAAGEMPPPNVNLGGSMANQIGSFAGGAIHMCAILNNNTVRCWGDLGGGDGRLGFEPRIIGDSEAPIVVGDVPIF